MFVSPNRVPVFLDTAYVNALVNTRDQWHQVAVEWQRQLAIEKRHLVTTEFVLIEIADGLAAIKFRQQASRVIGTLQTSPWVDVIPASSMLYARALALYRNRRDKDWGLTDCISFVVMAERDLTDALTTDSHFQQAGFRALLLDAPDD